MVLVWPCITPVLGHRGLLCYGLIPISCGEEGWGEQCLGCGFATVYLYLALRCLQYPAELQGYVGGSVAGKHPSSYHSLNPHGCSLSWCPHCHPQGSSLPEALELHTGLCQDLFCSLPDARVVVTNCKYLPLKTKWDFQKLSAVLKKHNYKAPCQVHK